MNTANSSSEPLQVNPAIPSDAIKILNSLANKASKAGAYTIDEAYLIKVSLHTLTLAIDGSGGDQTLKQPELVL